MGTRGSSQTTAACCGIYFGGDGRTRLYWTGIGLVLSSVLGNPSINEALESTSKKFFGEGDILVENFEYLHEAFFQVGVGYFLAAGAMVALGLQKLAEIETVQVLQLNEQTGACTVTPEKIAKYLSDDSSISSSDDSITPDAVWKELFMRKEERAVKTLLLRDSIMKRFPHLNDTFRVETFIQASFAQNLYELVEVSPCTWVFLIPALAFANAVDLSHEVVNAASPNAAESVGYFFSTFSSIAPAACSVFLAAVWGADNYWKMMNIKNMIIPTLGSSTNGEAPKYEILPPPCEYESLRKSFDSSPSWIMPIESLWGHPATNAYEELFGRAGASGLSLYRNSIKYQSWLCLTHIVFFGTQIVPRDVSAIIVGATNVGDPEHLTAELITYSSYVLLSIFQLTLISPNTFWNFCLVACEDQGTSEELLKLSGNAPYSEPVSQPESGRSTSSSQIGGS